MTTQEQQYEKCPACGEEARMGCCHVARWAFGKRRAKEELTPEELAVFRAANRNKTARARAKKREADPEAYAAERRAELQRWRESNPDRARAKNADHNRAYRARKKEELEGHRARAAE
jgi:hypothetical protein